MLRCIGALVLLHSAAHESSRCLLSSSSLPCLGVGYRPPSSTFKEIG
jgi:hypothetical protein